MTPRERATKIADEFAGTVRGYPALRGAIEREIEDAVAEEREACRDVCRKVSDDYATCAKACADDETAVDEYEKFRHWATAAASLAWAISIRDAADKERGR